MKYLRELKMKKNKIRGRVFMKDRMNKKLEKEKKERGTVTCPWNHEPFVILTEGFT